MKCLHLGVDVAFTGFVMHEHYYFGSFDELCDFINILNDEVSDEIIHGYSISSAEVQYDVKGDM